MPDVNKAVLQRLNNLRGRSLSEVRKQDPQAFSLVADVLGEQRRSALVDALAEAPVDLGEVIDKLDPGDLVAVPTIDLVKNVLDAATVDEQVRAELLGKLEGEGLLTGGDDAPEQTLETEVALQGLLGRAELLSVGEGARLRQKALDALIEAVPTLDAVDDQALSGLVDAKAVTKPEAERLGLRVSLYHLANGDADVAQTLATAEFPSLGGTVGDVRDLLGLSEEELAQKLRKEGRGAVGDVAEERAAEIRGALAEAFPGEELRRRVAASKDLTAKLGVKRSSLDKVAKQNPGVELLALDYSPESPDMQALKLTGVSAEERTAVLGALKTQQRLFALTAQPETTVRLLEADYRSGLEVAADSLEVFQARTGLPLEEATVVHGRARETMAGITSMVGSVLDAVNGGFIGLPVANLPESVTDALRRIDGYADLFGPQDGCACGHCSSILSPAAYFVDLMQFVEQHVLSPVFTGPRANHALHLKTRRPDLWALDLSCENTHTVIPTLEVINEILEAYLARRRAPDADLADRRAILRLVYEDTLPGAQTSFALPFVLPVATVDAYLELFEVTRAEVLSTLGAPGDRIAAAGLRMSEPVRDLVITPRQGMTFLRRMYGIQFSTGSGSALRPVEAGDLMRATTLTREELGAVLATRFVTAGASPAVRIRSEKRSSDSVQNDIERVTGLSTAVLDRLHRFVRLWRHVPWSIDELDLVLEQVTRGTTPALDAGTLTEIVAVRDLADKFSLPVDVACALRGAIPVRGADGRPSLMDRLFNSRAHADVDGLLPDPGRAFVVPALRDTPGPDPDLALQRLLLGLQVDDADLASLVVSLADALGCDPDAANEADRAFALSRANLGLLYRHARLARLLRRPAADVARIAVLAGIPDGAVRGAADLAQLLDVDAWLRATRLDVDDLADALGHAPQSPDRHPDPIAIAADLIAAAEADEEPAHTAAALPSRLAAALGLATDKLNALCPLAAVDLADAAVLGAFSGGPTEPLETAVAAVARSARVFSDPVFTPDRLAFLHGSAGLFGGTDFAALSLEQLRRIHRYRSLIAPPSAGQPARPLPDPLAVQDALLGFTAAQRFAAVAPARLAQALGVDPAVVRVLVGAVEVGDDAVSGLGALADTVALARRTRLDVPALSLLASDSPAQLTAAVEALVSALGRNHPGDPDLQARLEPKEDALRSRKRDALAAYLIRDSSGRFTSLEDLYDYFLVDVQLQGCARTSRVVAAISSVQTYVHRILLNLEQDRRSVGAANRVHVLPSRIPRDEWAWRRNYRVWEANRKVFLWPENYLEPELRDDKTPLFKTLEEQLLQQDINEQNVLDAYGDYLDGFESVGTLQVAGAYHEFHTGGQTDVLHLFGVTPDDPPSYWYWTIENLHYSQVNPDRRVSHSARTKIGVSIPVRHVTPVVHLGRLFLFWNEVQTRSQQEFVDGNSRFRGYQHQVSVKYTALRLDGRWTPPQELAIPTLRHLREGGAVQDPLARRAAPFAPRNIPRHSTTLMAHTEPDEAYSLEGAHWRRVPCERLSGDRLLMNLDGFSPPAASGWRQGTALVDAFERRLRGFAPSDLSLQTLLWGGNRRVLHVGDHGEQRRLYAPVSGPGAFGWGGWVLGPSAFQHLLADVRHLRAFVLGRSSNLTTALARIHQVGASAARRGLPLATLRSAEVAASAVAGGPAGLILQGTGDVMAVLRDPAAAGSWRGVRLGTTVARDLSRLLFTRGVNGLLSTATQRSLAERPHLLIPHRSLALVGATGRLDFGGALGTYFREIFLHAPLLIANSLNARQNYRAAQQWYHYVFDPTARPDPWVNLTGLPPEAADAALRDRVWRYLEFRGLTTPRLREILTDQQAIEAYRRDPFNPHAIARLRISAYQKSTVMKYVENLIDWGDSLFTQFTTESVNEANVLYAMAQAILGPRPATAGDCGEAVSAPKSYERIRPSLARGSEFLQEVESIIWVAGRARTLKGRAAGSDGAFVTFAKPEAELALARATRSLELTETPLAVAAVGSADADGATVAVAQPMALHAAEVAGSFAAGAVDRTLTAPEPTGEALVSLVQRGEDPAPSKQLQWNRTGAEGWTQVGGALGQLVGGANGPLIDSFAPVATFGWSIVRQLGPVFCVPQNKDLLGLWDRVEDRLYKIRHCMDITGARRDLALFAPEIDPRLLVRARAEGLSVEDVLGVGAGPLPPYRFRYLIDKAKQYAGLVQGFGGQLRGALERRDAEQLVELRGRQQLEVAKFTTRLREWEIQVAQHAVGQLERQRDAVAYRRDYYEKTLDEDLNPWERAYQVTHWGAAASKLVSAALKGTGGVLYLLPQLGSPFAMKYGGKEVASSAKTWGEAFSDTAAHLEIISKLADMEGKFDRRRKGWKQQITTAEQELQQLDRQLAAARLRVQIAERSLELHQQGIEDQEEILAFFQDRFSSLGLYTWLSTSLQRSYRQAFNAAHALAKMAERAYRFERDDDAAVLLRPTYWSSAHAGLSSGEALMADLVDMERRFIESDRRMLEVEQTFSLRQIAPQALIALRGTGECEVPLPELLFDLVHPGHYRRRIRAVRLSMPTGSGADGDVAATLALQRSFIRRDPAPGDAGLEEVSHAASPIAISSGERAAGVFEFSFRDERYLPFEGAGAVSEWTLTLPRNFRPFDYDAIEDVLVHVSYTALSDGVLRQRVEEDNAALEGSIAAALAEHPLPRAISLRMEHPTELAAAMAAAPGTPVQLTLDGRTLPVVLRGRAVTVERALLLLRPADGLTGAGFSVRLNGRSLTGFAAAPDFPGHRQIDARAALAAGLVGEHELRIEDGGDLRPDAGTGAVDPDRLVDLVLYVELSV